MSDRYPCPPLVRNLRGTVHHPDCIYAKSGKPWLWAVGRAEEDVADIVWRGDTGLKECGRCLPFIGCNRKAYR